MKNFVLFFPSTERVSSAFEGLSEKMSLRENQMLSCIPQDTVNIFMVRSLDNFLGGNKFTPEFQLQGNTWENIKQNTPVLGDLVYGFRMPKGVTHTHPSQISEITKDKRIIENLLPEYSMKSIVCNDYNDILKSFNTISSTLRVLKPYSGSLGKGIFIQESIPKQDELKEIDYPYLLQEFHDTSGGFYGLCPGLHDFRVVILNGEIIAKLLREPADNGYISNTFQGGKIQDIFSFNIPTQIEKVILEIDNYCKKYDHRYYAIDMGVGIDGSIKVFEINGAPGYASEYMAKKFGEYISQHILQIA